MKLGLLLRTLAYLRWEQLAYRPWRVAQFRCYRAFPMLAKRWIEGSNAPAVSDEIVKTLRAQLEESFVHWQEPLTAYEQRLNDLLVDRFTLLNRTCELKPLDWNRRYENHLWNYQLHYFGFVWWSARALVERGEELVWRRCRELIAGWIAEARVGRSDGWAAYPVALRVVNWIYAYALVSEVEKDQAFLDKWRASIYRQMDFLSRHLEHQLLANHLLKNAKALVIGGLFFAEDQHGAQWLAQGERLLWREFDEQVLADGGHYERAPMYHALALADVAECFALLRAFNRAPQPVQAIEERLRVMARFLEALTYPDGTLARFNDSANTEDAQPPPILAMVERVVGLSDERFAPVFPETGYYLWVAEDGAERIIVDAGPPAADYNTAHAHCDLLSYELWLAGRPFIVDAGVHGYGGDRFREYARSTRAHNTVMFDEQEQSEVWDTFRLARRAELLRVEANSDKQAWHFWGAYRPYYAGAPIHERYFRREAGGDWVITDTAYEGQVERAASFIHLHPQVRARCRADAHAVVCEQGAAQIMIEPFAADGGAIRTELVKGQENPLQGWYFPDFGLAEPNQTIIFHYRIKTGEAFGYRIHQH